MNKSRTMSAIRWLSLAFVIITMACNDRTEPSGVATASPSPVLSPTPMLSPGASPRVADVTGNPDNYIGKTVTVTSDIDEVRGPRVFKLDDDAPLAGGIDNDLWVVSPQAGNLATIDDKWLNNKVRVTGTVHRFAVAEIEREIGWDLDPKIEADIEKTKAVLIANSIERVQ